jgi:hypothetical protein
MTRHSADELVSSDVTGMHVILPESERAAPDGQHSAPGTTTSVRRPRGRPEMSDEQQATAAKERLRQQAEKAGLRLADGTDHSGITEYAPGTSLEPHPLCAMFPLMTDDELDELAEDIRRHGQREPGTILDGKILDGRSRDLACERVGIPFRRTVTTATIRSGSSFRPTSTVGT